ncbi:MAG: hypothetical protein AAGL11_10795 [Pseudomonadota bacterium]
MTETRLSPGTLANIDVAGWSFLHQQGRALCRGRVIGLTCDEERWDLDLGQVEYWNWQTKCWETAKDEDEYGSSFGYAWQADLDPKTGIISLPGYAMETYLAPKSAAPWSDVEWPETDSYPGGPMDQNTNF